MISSPAEYYVVLSPALGGAPQFVDDDGGCDSGRAGRIPRSVRDLSGKNHRLVTTERRR